MAKAGNALEAKKLEQIPNIGPSIAEDLRQLGINTPSQLIGKDPYQLFQKLCSHTGVRVDPCVADVFISAVRFMEGAPPTPWWKYTQERKQYFKKEG